MPADQTTVTSGPGRRLVVADGTVELEVTFTPSSEHEAQAEFVLLRSGDLDALHELTEALAGILAEPPYDQANVALVADRASEAPDPLAEGLAEDLGLGQRRELLQMRRPLPVELDHAERGRAPAISLRPIDLDDGGDEQHGEGDVGAWLRVNNRAFATHPDQGQETVTTFSDRLDGEHDDPSGFLVFDDDRRPGELAGFCWTKVHEATPTDLELGEIYVIGVDPSRHGEGLGTSLVLAGLDHLAAVAIPTAMLYVEADNEPALRLYDRLGFTTHRWRRMYAGDAA